MEWISEQDIFKSTSHRNMDAECRVVSAKPIRQDQRSTEQHSARVGRRVLTNPNPESVRLLLIMRAISGRFRMFWPLLILLCFIQSFAGAELEDRVGLSRCGQAVEGWQLCIRADKKDYAVGEQITLVVGLKNSTDEARQVILGLPFGSTDFEVL